jgi:hypothetical protein
MPAIRDFIRHMAPGFLSPTYNGQSIPVPDNVGSRGIGCPNSDTLDFGVSRRRDDDVAEVVHLEERRSESGHGNALQANNSNVN